MTAELNDAQVESLKAEVEAFLVERNFTRVDPRDITGVNAGYEFHIYMGKKGISVTIIDRMDPERIDEDFIKYDDQAVVHLYNLIGR